MQFLFWLFATLLFGGSLIYLLLCVDPNEGGILGKLHNIFYSSLPSAVKGIGTKIFGKRFNRGIDKFVQYICYSNHRLVQLMYVLFAYGGYLWFVYYIMIPYFPSPHVSSVHLVTGSALMFFCYFVYYKACTVSPGILTRLNASNCAKKYAYDGILFKPDTICQTCKIVKSARSKHCRICNVCVEKFDHHCVWIRQCVGEKNYKWFLSFIFCHSMLCFYGCYVTSMIVYGIIIDNKLTTVSFIRKDSRERITSSPFIILQYMLGNYVEVVTILVLNLVMSVTLLIFFFYHYSLVRGGITTNESIKKSVELSNYKEIINMYEKKLKNQKQKDITSMSEAELQDHQKSLKNIMDKIETYKKSEASLKLYKHPTTLLEIFKAQLYM